jgi:hypothetical protein
MPKHQAPRSWQVRYCKREPARAGLSTGRQVQKKRRLCLHNSVWRRPLPTALDFGYAKASTSPQLQLMWHPSEEGALALDAWQQHTR